jgi:hypothetical protein
MVAMPSIAQAYPADPTAKAVGGKYYFYRSSEKYR